MKIDTFHLQLEKNVFFPGEVVKGSLMVQSQQYIKCKGIRITMKGKGRCLFTTGAGKNRHTHTHTQVYCQSKRTVWGSVIKTPVLDQVGENAVFGPPWAPDEGVLYVPVGEFQNDLILRVMDYDWGKKDDLLGEVHIDIRHYVDQGDKTHTVPLTRNGRAEKGTVSFSIRWETENVPLDSRNINNRTIRLQIISALGLRNAEWVGKNDVYVQAYAVNADAIVPGAAFNVPHETVDLPPCSMEIPFDFQLPSDLPSSMVYNGNNFITYSIYANIDIAWKTDISHRVFFTVIQPTAAACNLTPLYRSLQTSIHNQCFIPPCCCCNIPLVCCGDYGSVKIHAYLDRASYAPGEMMRLLVKLDSTWADSSSRMKIQAQLERVSTLSADGRTREESTPIAAGIEITSFNETFDMEVPPLAPTYLGGLGQDLNWFGQVSRYGGRWASKRPDPIVWYYRMHILAEYREPGCTVWDSSKDLYIPVNITAIGLSVLPVVAVPLSGSYPSVSIVTVDDPTGQMMQHPTALGVMGGQPYSVVPSQQPTIDYSEPLDVNHIVFPQAETPAEPVPLPSWQSIPEIRRSTSLLTQCPLVPHGAPVMIRDEEEDHTADADSLMYRPSYYTSNSLRHK